MEGQIDQTWRALADPTRRALLDALREGPKLTGELAAAFPELSRFGVMKHLSVLKDAGLVLVREDGRKRWNFLNAVPLREVYERWVSRYEDRWASSLLDLKRRVETHIDAEEHAMTKVEEIGQARVVRVEEEITINAPRERVFKTFTEETGQWFWRGEGNVNHPAVFEPQPGGRFYGHWNSPDGPAFEMYATVGVFKPNKYVRLLGAMSSRFATASTVEIQFEGDGDSTTIKVTHRLAGEIDPDELAGYSEGWASELGALKTFVETGEPRQG